jgi:hypothetical protein
MAPDSVSECAQSQFLGHLEEHRDSHKAVTPHSEMALNFNPFKK